MYWVDQNVRSGFFIRWMMVEWLSRVWLFATPCSVALQAPLSMGLSRQEYRSGLPFPSPGHLPDPGIEPASPALASGFLSTEPSGKPQNICNRNLSEEMWTEDITKGVIKKVIFGRKPQTIINNKRNRKGKNRTHSERSSVQLLSCV